MGISILAWLSSRDPHIGPRRSRGMITRPIWKCPCIKLFITYFRHLEKRHPYWPETKSRPILARASISKCSCSNPITGYFPGVWKYGQFTSGHIGHTININYIISQTRTLYNASTPTRFRKNTGLYIYSVYSGFGRGG